MKKIQCTNCGQVFWTELQIDETLVSSGEWVQNPCPKCGGKWAVVEPGRVVRGKRGRRAIARPKGRGRAKKEASFTAQGKEPTFSGSEIRRLRKKLKLSQKELGSLLGVSTGSIVSWEKGTFSPRKNKVAQLSELAGKEKEEVRNLLPAKKPAHEEGSKEIPGAVRMQELKSSGREGARSRRVSRGKEKKAS